MKIVFLDGTKGFSPHRLKEKACGGINTSLTLIPRYLVKRGHEVIVKSVYEKREVVDGVQYLTHLDEVKNFDICIFNRNVLSNGLVQQANAAGAKLVWWLHDIVDHRYLCDDAFVKIPNIVALSGYCMKTYSEYYGIPKHRFSIIPNGVDQNTFFPGKYSKRDKNLFIFASSPIKGMKPLAFTMNNIRRMNPKAKLLVYGSQSLHDLKDDALVGHWMDEIKKEGAEIIGPVQQDELADSFRSAWALLMPNSYPEICSNLILQARACGLPVVTSNTGSNGEFLKEKVTGRLTDSFPHDVYFWWAEFARKTMELIVDENLHRMISENAPTGISTWDEIGQAWNRYLTDIHQSRSSEVKQGAMLGF